MPKSSCRSSSSPRAHNTSEGDGIAAAIDRASADLPDSGVTLDEHDLWRPGQRPFDDRDDRGLLGGASDEDLRVPRVLAARKPAVPPRHRPRRYRSALSGAESRGQEERELVSIRIWTDSKIGATVRPCRA